ncbi:MAG: glutathione S-transferase [Sphingomicrobium sp.]
MITLCGFGVSNYYNKLKLVLLEKQIPFRERTVYPWERDTFVQASPLGKIPFVETDEGRLSESQVILEYLEERYPTTPLYPADPYRRAKCRELIQHLELNAEWVARRLYKECFFGGRVSDETKQEAYNRLVAGLEAINRLAKFALFICGAEFTAADCAAYVHFTMIRSATSTIYSENLLLKLVPKATAYMAMMDDRPHFRRMMGEREASLTACAALGVPYEG